MDRALKPNAEISPSCPRCGSSNTKFCYYNNYSLTQPRYFCKGCRRYWTKGGSLRNVPIGGGCRKNRRAKSLRLSSTDYHVSNNHSKSLGYGGISTCDSTLSYKGTSSSSSTISDGSYIDLALVYANFLNPQPVSSTSSSSNFGMLDLGSSDFAPSLDFTNLEPNLPDGCITAMEAPLAENDHQLMYYYGMDSLLADNKYQADDDHKIQRCTTNDHLNDTNNYGLPPLPREEVGSLWPNSDHNLNHTMQVTQVPVPGPETHDPNSLLMGDWSPFDLSSDDTFSRT